MQIRFLPRAQSERSERRGPGARRRRAVCAGIERRSDVAQACATVRRCPDKLLRRQKLSRGRFLPRAPTRPTGKLERGYCIVNEFVNPNSKYRGSGADAGVPGSPRSASGGGYRSASIKYSPPPTRSAAHTYGVFAGHASPALGICQTYVPLTGFPPAMSPAGWPLCTSSTHSDIAEPSGALIVRHLMVVVASSGTVILSIVELASTRSPVKSSGTPATWTVVVAPLTLPAAVRQSR